MPKQFFITFWERSGSTFLVDLLNQHPQVICGEEILAGDEAAPVQRPPFSDEEAFKKIKTIYSNTDKLCQGFKFKFPHQHLNFQKVAQHLYQTKAVIFLYRKNIIKLFISKLNQLALHQDYGVSIIAHDQNIMLRKKISWQKDHERLFETYLPAALAYNLSVYKNILKAGRDFHVLSYEDLVGHTAESLNAIYNFLGVDKIEESHPVSKLKKISSDSVETNFQNPEDFLRFVRKTQFNHCLSQEGHIIECWEKEYSILTAKTWPDIADFEQKSFQIETESS